MVTINQSLIKSLLKPRKPDAHKGNFGHGLIIAGSRGKMGAAVIASKACLRSGIGMLTVAVPKKERAILQTAVPEAMLIFREESETDLNHFDALGIGPGIGNSKRTLQILDEILINFKNPIIIDADALNCIAENNYLLQNLPANTILTPHPKEFDRLFGFHNTMEERIITAQIKASEYKIIIVLKGHKTIVTNGLATFINVTGNAGLAKAGSGDALTGIITAFLSQGYFPFEACKISIYLHGLAADFAIKTHSLESLVISDVIEFMSSAFKNTYE